MHITNKATYQEQKQKETVSMLKSLIRKIEKGEFEVLSGSWWVEGTPDRYSFLVHVKDSES